MIDERDSMPATNNEKTTNLILDRSKPKKWSNSGWHWLLVLPLMFIFQLLKDQRQLPSLLGWPLLDALLIGAVFLGILQSTPRLFSAMFQVSDGKTDAPRDPAPFPSTPTPYLKNDNSSVVFDQGKESCRVPDQRITALPIPAAPPTSSAEWHVIHGGEEFGPMTLAELVEKAVAGQVEADDLAKQNGGLWTKARDFSFLKQVIVNPPAKDTASNALDADLVGPTFSKKEYVIRFCALLACVGLILWGIISKATNPRPPMAAAKSIVNSSPLVFDPPLDIKNSAVDSLLNNALCGTPAYIPPVFDPTPDIVKQPEKVFVDATNLYIKPDITIKGQSDLSGHVYGSLHNGTGKTIERMKLSIKTPKWERAYETSCVTRDNTTNTFVIHIGEESLSVWGCRLLGVVFAAD